ncbi:type II secretion system protein [Quisquiliibacterium transsilvanicum]|uniref:Prepilin-type N-terminal cleavage/methylation domain-containing protein n=1 Tax=Quisquiliibacterium transsilvanicum TaxID=1549638 RepID=A0A7W8M8S4_9BURK|nr:prepilin-type N-terminal cleavage/methylation domain-containing protein [Quisquiliibacterium transsilvanicum]MBB5272068.1 prepilin-type N-terminal cleavage/methylation domain-containing protein [Quisquiliibacterium transsilvanicum]
MKFKRSKQSGFTLVELSVVVLIAGLLLMAVMKGQTMLENARAQKLVNDIKNVEALIGQYENVKGRLPGDCNRDGVIGFAPFATAGFFSLTGNAARSDLYDYSGSDIGATAGEPAVAVDGLAFCAETGNTATAESNANRWLNDMRAEGVVSRATTNRLFTKHVAEDFLFVGSLAVASTEVYNVIVIANVPTWMAKKVAVNINGSESLSSRGQLRAVAGTAFTPGAAFLVSWPANNDTVVNLVYFFRNVPNAADSTT